MTCTDAELIDRVSKGDMDAFSILIGKYSNAVYGVAYSKLGDFHIAEDIAQEVFVKTYRKIPSIKEPEKLASWLYAVTTRECLDWFRSNQKKTTYEFMEQMEVLQLETTEDKLLRKEFQHDVWRALNTLSEANRIVTVLYYIDNYKVREIADFLNLSIEAVESRLRRSRTILKKEMLSTVNNNLSENKLQDEFKKKVFQDERMPEANFRRVAMGQSEFDDIDMHKTNFSNVNMEGTRFDNINMSKTTFNDINMHTVKFNEVGLWEIEVSNSEMGEAYFHDIHVYGKGNKFERCQLNGTSFVDCDLSNVDIRDCKISGFTVNGVSLEALLESYHQNK